ncbi:MAG: HRDC domain-containing protein [Actinomycetota bacterium]|nr:HRDC domain-containing protein [Actinomycetota bacterium]
MKRQPSPWLEEIEAARGALAAGSAPSGPAEWRSRLAAERARLRGARGGQANNRRRGPLQVGGDADPELLAALKAWRAGAAKAGGVPAFVVFHDATLATLAEARPSNRKDLLAVPGLGPVKAERYGQALLEVLATHPTSKSKPEA